jgi:hypothetical protein
MPAATYARVRSSRSKRISASSSCSSRVRRKTSRKLLRIFWFHPFVRFLFAFLFVLRARWLCGFQNQADRFRQSLPICFFHFEPLFSGRGEAIEFCAAIIFRFAPIGCDPAAMLQSVKRGIQRTLTHLQSLARNLLDAQRDSVAVLRAESKRFQNKQIERPLQKFLIQRAHWIGFPLFPRRSTGR